MKLLQGSALLTSTALLVSCAIETDAAWTPVPAHQKYEDKSLSDLAIEWARWSYSNTSCASPDQDQDGSLCDYYQPRGENVFFFAGGSSGTARTKCRVPENKAIVVPLDVYMIDNGGVAESDQLSESEMRSEAERFMGTVADLRLVVDGEEVSDLEQHEVRPTRFAYELPLEPNWYSCNGQPGVTGTVDPAIVAGYFVVMPPPPIGRHTIEYAGVGRLGDETVTSHVKSAFEVY
jgi:hypothetical protein